MGCQISLRRLFLYLLGPSIIVVYIVLSWIQSVPSVIHIPVIRRVWDSEFSKCMLHIDKEKSLKKTLFVTARLSGRLGNWMFAYASLLGIAKQNNRTFFTRFDADPRVSLIKTFQVKHVTELTPVCSQPIYEKLPCAYDSKMELLPLTNITIHGYLQSWKYFKDAVSEVRREFRFKHNILVEATRIFHHYVGNHSETTCVHVRRTDMMIASSKKLGFKAASLSYIINAMEHFRTKNVTFVVISDDFNWCIKNLKFNDSVIIPQNMPEIDLALLTMCNNSIITTGTFGWWGAWLANGETVYYKNYPEPGTRLSRDTVHEDFFPPHWIPVDGASHMNISLKMVLLCSMIVTYLNKFKK